ncbi:hypothetical protein SAMN05192558_11830 [Actinokineospora alba]|uniref:Uncharacterized protein n=1 Tax=Actinokineospora alba TaxID=504798 RepID=A0A1H0W6V5_9PSEU|nr:hypothetical protein C8E96_5624 [Actinokineospora alba]SDJ49696.1 hypothetical protein SAMN05421871_11730 [Actinokineospora alba]SDP86348.1 hypothetical protein SAMN05192558_11830 [Actinokineospora alba]
MKPAPIGHASVAPPYAAMTTLICRSERDER